MTPSSVGMGADNVDKTEKRRPTFDMKDAGEDSSDGGQEEFFEQQRSAGMSDLPAQRNRRNANLALHRHHTDVGNTRQTTNLGELESYSRARGEDLAGELSQEKPRESSAEKMFQDPLETVKQDPPKAKIISNRKNKTNNMMAMAASVMPSHNVTAAKEELKTEINSHEGPVQVEAAIPLSRRTSTGAQGRTNLMGRSRTNLLAGGAMGGSGKTGESVPSRPATEVAGGKDLAKLAPLQVVEEEPKRVPSPNESEPPKKERRGKKFVKNIKNFLGSSVAVFSDATSMATNPIGSIQKVRQATDDLAHIGGGIRDTLQGMVEEDGLDFGDTRDASLSEVGPGMGDAVRNLGEYALRKTDSDKTIGQSRGNLLKANNRNSGPIPDAKSFMRETDQIGQKADGLTQSSLLTQYNQNKNVKARGLGPYSNMQDEIAEVPEEDKTDSEDTEMNNSFSSSVNLDDLEDQEEALESEKQQLADMLAGRDGERSSSSDEDEELERGRADARAGGKLVRQSSNTAAKEFMKHLAVYNDGGEHKGADTRMSQRLTKRNTLQVKRDQTIEAQFGRYVDDDLEMLKVVGANEKHFRQAAQDKLKHKEPLSLKTTKRQRLEEGSLGYQRVLDGPTLVQHVWSYIRQTAFKEKTRPTAVQLSDDLIFVGMSNGELLGFTKDGQKLWGKYSPEGKEYVKNAVTCLDIHPKRPEYVAIGYSGGQLILLDCTDFKKAVKKINEHHKNSSVVTVRFVDWVKERNLKDVLQQAKSISKKEDKQLWMFVSSDTEGRVIITTIKNIALGYRDATKIYVIDPKQSINTPMYPTISCKFHSEKYPQKLGNEGASLMALGSSREVVIYNVINEKPALIYRIKRPLQYPSQNMSDIVQFEKPHQIPNLTWGYGRTPVFKDETYVLLAIAWGPLIQLIVVNDIGSKHNEDFFPDGYYFIAPNTVMERTDGNQELADIWIESIKFLDESLILATTNTRTVRVLYTQKFLPGLFEPPANNWSQMEESSLAGGLDEIHKSLNTKAEIIKAIEKLDSRGKAMPQGGQPLTKQQCEVEMERGNQLDGRVWPSQFGLALSQTIALYDQHALFLTEAGLFMMNHLSWTQAVEMLQTLRKGNWIQVFARTLEIWKGTVKGFRGIVDEDHIRKQVMRGEMKALIHVNVQIVINSWNIDPRIINALSNPNIVITNMEQDEEIRTIENNFRILVRMSIEFCVEVAEPDFLLREIFQLFVDEGAGSLLAEELEPYILSGQFAEQPFPEDIISMHILQHYQRVLLAGNDGEASNFEKILINLNFSDCSEKYKFSVLEFCKAHNLTTGLIHMCLQLYGPVGPVRAVEQLMNAWCSSHKSAESGILAIRSAMEEGKMNAEEAESQVTIKALKVTAHQLRSLKTMPDKHADRMPIETSHMYIGYKLFWMIRRFLRGKFFPSGALSRDDWNNTVHDVLELITRKYYLEILLEVDPAAYFQIISIVFNSALPQAEFLTVGRPAENENISMTHTLLVSRLANYRTQIEKGSLPSIYFNFFISNIAQNPLLSQEKDLFYSVLVELLDNDKRFIEYHKRVFDTQMRRHRKQRKLTALQKSELAERLWVDPEDKVLELMALSEPITDETEEEGERPLDSSGRPQQPRTENKLDRLIEKADQTDFVTLKVILREKKQEYLQCLDLLLQNEPSKMRNFVNKKKDTYQWIMEKLYQIKSLVGYDPDDPDQASNQPKSKNSPYLNLYKKFKQKVLDSVYILVRNDAHRTVGLADIIFNENHLEMIERIGNRSEERLEDQFVYLSKLIEVKHDKIKQAVTNMTSMNMDIKESNQSLQYLKMHLELACRIAKDKVIDIVATACKQNCLSIEDFITICHKYDQVEAEALLYRKLGNYNKSIKLYLKVLSEIVEPHTAALKKELFYLHSVKKARGEQDKADRKSAAITMPKIQAALTGRAGKQEEKKATEPSADDQVKSLWRKKLSLRMTRLIQRKFVDEIAQELTPLVTKFHKVYMKLESIVRKHPQEVLINPQKETWKKIIEFFYKIQREEKIRKKEYVRNWMKKYQMMFVKQCVGSLPFTEVLDVLLKNRRKLKYQTIADSVNELFDERLAEEVLCSSAYSTILEDNEAMMKDTHHVKHMGVNFNTLKCDLCKRQVNRNFMEEEGKESSLELFDEHDPLNERLMLFECNRSQKNHCFHQRCLYLFDKEETSKDAARTNQRAAARPLEQDWRERLRCTVCEDGSQDIVPALASYRRAQGSAWEQMNEGMDRKQTRRFKRKSASRSSNSDMSSTDGEAGPTVADIQARFVQRQRDSIRALRKKEKGNNDRILLRFDRELHYSNLTGESFQL